MVALTSVNPVGIASGLGPGDITWGAQSEPSQVMASSAGVASILNDYYMLGQTTNLYTFGAQGYASAGLNPVAQFVGSFTSTITPANGGINLTLSNYTSVHSLGDAGGDAGGGDAGTSYLSPLNLLRNFSKASGSETLWAIIKPKPYRGIHILRTSL
jgi:hypothetical protein